MTKCVTTGSALWIVSAVLAVWASTASVSMAADQPPDFKRLIDRHAPAVVTVKFVMKMQMGMMGESESETEIPGVMIDPKGLVLCTNSQLQGPMGMTKRFMPPGMDMTSEPKDVKVVIGADEAEYEAKILARDTDLDLAWVQIKNPADVKFAAVDLEDSATVSVGETLVCVRRLGKLFNRAPAVRCGRICGEAKSPRHLFIGDTELASAVGCPAFTTSGKLAGIVVLQMPDEDDASPGNPMAMFGSMSAMAEMFAGVILPVRQVASATQRVRERYMNTSATSDEGS